MANIFQQYLQPAKSVMDYTAEMDQADARKNAIQQSALALQDGQMKLDVARQEVAANNALSRLVAQGSTPDVVAAELARQGYGKHAMTYLKQQQEMDKAKADVGHLNAQTGELKSKTAKSEYDLTEQKRQKAISDIASFTDPQQAMISLQQHIEAGDIAPEQGAMIQQTIPQNPADFPKWQIGMLQRIMSAKEAAGQIAPDANARLQADTSRANNAATNAVAMRGQNMTDARTREQLQQGKVPAGYRANPDGSMSYIPGGPADPNTGGGKMTEDQGKATGWLVQAENAYKNMMSVGVDKNGNPTSAAKPGFNDALGAIPGFGGVANSMRSADRQKFMQATSSLSEALLRAATGAGVNRDEAAQKVQELTPLYGEDPEVTKQKYAAIPLYIESLKVRAGPGASKAAGVLAGGSSAASPNIDALLKKYGQ